MTNIEIARLFVCSVGYTVSWHSEQRAESSGVEEVAEAKDEDSEDLFTILTGPGLHRAPTVCVLVCNVQYNSRLPCECHCICRSSSWN